MIFAIIVIFDCILLCGKIVVSFSINYRYKLTEAKYWIVSNERCITMVEKKTCGIRNGKPKVCMCHPGGANSM